MSKNLSNKHKSKLKDIIELHYNNHVTTQDNLKLVFEDIHKKSGLSIELDSVCKYIETFLHANNNQEIIIKPNKKNVINIKKKKTKIEAKEECISNEINNQADDSEEVEIVIFEKIEETKEETKEETNTEDLAKEFSKMMAENNAIIIEKKNYNLSNYKYPNESNYNYIKKTDSKFGPYGTQWIHEEQKDDEITSVIEKRRDRFRKLIEIKFPEQKSIKWLEMRESKITASDMGCVIGENKYEPSWRFILKKLYKMPFRGNMNTYHGNKYERIATMIYEYRMNVVIHDFGLLEHDTIKFLGASPDGIISEYKADKKHKTKFVGRMLEIKCPVSRDIKITDSVEDTVPIYYYCQVQQQLEVCELDECDFWQCKIYEYNNREEFIEDTHPMEPFRSKLNELEKGCLIQLMPKVIKNREKEYEDLIYEHAKFIHPPKIEMTPYECDMWILETINKVNNDVDFMDYYVDRVVYWRLDVSHCITIKRDIEWFKSKLPLMKAAWEQVEFFRKNSEAKKILSDYLNSVGLDITVEDRSFNTKTFEKSITNIINKIQMAFNIESEKELRMKEIREEISKSKIKEKKVYNGNIYMKPYKKKVENYKSKNIKEVESEEILILD
jgi:putative phage-type endonuclease